MKMLLTIGLVILFISVLLIQMTFDGLVRNEVKCIVNTGFVGSCDTRVAMSSFFGIMIISFFVIIDIGTWYLIFTHVFKRSKREVYF